MAQSGLGGRGITFDDTANIPRRGADCVGRAIAPIWVDEAGAAASTRVARARATLAQALESHVIDSAPEHVYSHVHHEGCRAVAQLCGRGYIRPS